MGRYFALVILRLGNWMTRPGSKFRCILFDLAQVGFAVLDYAILVRPIERWVLERLVGLVFSVKCSIGIRHIHHSS
jgi:hypothetical protein